MCCFVKLKLGRTENMLDICDSNSAIFWFLWKMLKPKKIYSFTDSENTKKRFFKNLELCCFVWQGQSAKLLNDLIFD